MRGDRGLRCALEALAQEATWRWSRAGHVQGHRELAAGCWLGRDGNSAMGVGFLAGRWECPGLAGGVSRVAAQTPHKRTAGIGECGVGGSGLR